MKDKQTPQVIVLGILVVICVAFVVVKVTGGKGHSKPAPAGTQTAQKTASTTGKTDDNSEEAAPAIQLASLPSAARRDPFAPAMDTVVKNVPYIPPTKHPVKTARINIHPANIPVLPMPVLPVGAGPRNTAQAVPASSVGNGPAVEEFPAFVLTGVITGRTNVAIIRLEDSRYIVKEGQLINGKYMVVSVSPDGVRLNHGGRSVFLKLGGEGNAS
ncbi:MAG: hypothetical protein ABFD64_08650 [Armatimonadota bacterium]